MLTRVLRCVLAKHSTRLRVLKKWTLFWDKRENYQQKLYNAIQSSNTSRFDLRGRSHLCWKEMGAALNFGSAQRSGMHILTWTEVIREQRKCLLCKKNIVMDKRFWNVVEKTDAMKGCLHLNIWNCWSLALLSIFVFLKYLLYVWIRVSSLLKIVKLRHVPKSLK